MKLSVCLATYNEEENLGRCLAAIKNISDEIVIVDGTSKDKTVEIANTYNAKVIVAENHPIFHINKQKAIDACTGDWILQLDADEVVSSELANEILHVINLSAKDREEYQKTLKNRELFLRHQKLSAPNGKIGENEGEIAAFFIPRRNYFLGKFLTYGGVYPDGVIRLIKKGKAFLPAKDVHELMVVKGRVGWLENDLYHYDSPTFERYIYRNNRYINLIVDDMKRDKLPKTVSNFVSYMILKPLSWFFMTQIRHKGILDGYQGIIFSFFSALRFPRAYWRYLKHSL